MRTGTNPWATEYATANSDVNPTSYDIYIVALPWDSLSSPTVVADCGAGTQCQATVTQPYGDLPRPCLGAVACSWRVAADNTQHGAVEAQTYLSVTDSPFYIEIFAYSNDEYGTLTSNKLLKICTPDLDGVTYQGLVAFIAPWANALLPPDPVAVSNIQPGV